MAQLPMFSTRMQPNARQWIYDRAAALGKTTRFVVEQMVQTFAGPAMPADFEPGKQMEGDGDD